MAFNIYLCGVGGQGIGLVAEALAQAAAGAGLKTLACDTHSLAQRGGVVSSHIRLGEGALTPMVPEGGADLVLALERFEAARAAAVYLKRGGRLVYYDTAWQPVHVRMGKAPRISAEQVAAAVKEAGGAVERVFLSGLADPRMQNAAVLGRLAAIGAVPGLGASAIEGSLKDILPPASLDENLKIFRAALAGNGN